MTSLSVLIPFGGEEEWRSRSFYWLLDRYSKLLPGAQIVVGSSPDPFNRAAARNNAFSQAKGDVLLIADADTLFHADQVETAVNMLQGRRTWIIPYNWYYNLSQETSENILQLDSGETIMEPTSPASWEHKIESWAGLLVMPREVFEMAGGYDERFNGWGYEDNAFRLALDTLWGDFMRLSWGYCLHLWHPTDGGFEQPHIHENRTLFREYEAASGNPESMRKLLSDR